MENKYLITSNLQKQLILLTICGRMCNETVRGIREDIVPLLHLFDEPVTLVVDLREASGNHLDAIDELRELWAQYERTSIGQLVRVFANEEDDQGSRISDLFHLKGVRKMSTTRMDKALAYSESFAESLG